MYKRQAKGREKLHMRKFSKKQIGAVGLVVIMSAQGPVMAAEVAQEETASEVSTTEIAEQETERIEDESVEETQEMCIRDRLYRRRKTGAQSWLEIH